MQQRYSLLPFVLTPLTLLAWGPDNPISAVGSSAHAVTEAPTGGLIAAIADDTAGNGVAVRFHTSDDGGLTWTPAPYTAPGNGVPQRVKLLPTASTVYCLFIDDGSVRVYNTVSGATGAYLDFTAQEFDAVVNSTGWIYLFVQPAGSNQIRRAGTSDGGITWTGNSAQVTGNGAVPRVAISAGDTVVLNYYGPVLADIPKSVVRSAVYNQTVPGTLNVPGGAFVDAIPETNFDKWRYSSAIRGGRVWLFWEQEPVGQRILRCKVSANNGFAYGTAFQVAGGAGADINGHAAVARAASGTTRVDLVYGRYTTPGQTDPGLDQLWYTRAVIAAPQTFDPPTPVSEHAPVLATTAQGPTVVALQSGGTGAAWAGFTSSGNQLFWDADPISTSVAATTVAATSGAWPNPTANELFVSVPGSIAQPLYAMDALGRRAPLPCEAVRDGVVRCGTAHLTPGFYLVGREGGRDFVRVIVDR